MSIPFDIPSTWSWCRLSTIAEIRNGFTPRRDNPSYWTNGNIPWFTIADKNEQGLFINRTAQHITSVATTVERIVPANSVLLCCTASVGEVAYTNIPLTTNQQFNGITIKENYHNIVNSFFLLFFSFTLKDFLKKELATATTFGFVSVKKVGSIMIPIPPLKEQLKIVDKLNAIFSEIEKINTACIDKGALCDKLKYKLLDHYFGDNSRYKSYYENELKLGDILKYEQPAKYIVNSTNYSDDFATPVLTPGKTFILGYTNEKEGIYHVNGEKVIIFDDFTTASRLVDFNFKVKSSAMKILTISNQELFDVEYMYLLLQTIHVNNNTHKRYWISDFATRKVKIHTIQEQTLIVKEIKKLYSIIEKVVG